MKYVELDISSLQELCFIEEICFKNDKWTEQMLTGEFGSDCSIFLGAVENEKVIGYLSARLIIDEAHINNVAVLPEQRRRGIAEGLLEKLFSVCCEKGVSKFTLEVGTSNLPAVQLYQKMKFESCGVRKNYYHTNEDAYIMWLTKDGLRDI